MSSWAPYSRIIRPAGMSQGVRVRVQDHACERYAQRVRPDLTGHPGLRSVIYEELDTHGEACDRPEWEEPRAETAFWLRVDDVYFPCVKVPRRGREFAVVTVLTKMLQEARLDCASGRPPPLSRWIGRGPGPRVLAPDAEAFIAARARERETAA
jgi:hypothetical protein